VKNEEQQADDWHNRPIIYCTECDKELENFCFTSGANNPEALKKNLEQCKKSGKFHGEFCSKLFMAESNEPQPEDPTIE
jgi:hypothetical protein